MRNFDRSGCPGNSPVCWTGAPADWTSYWVTVRQSTSPLLLCISHASKQASTSVLVPLLTFRKAVGIFVHPCLIWGWCLWNLLAVPQSGLYATPNEAFHFISQCSHLVTVLLKGAPPLTCHQWTGSQNIFPEYLLLPLIHWLQVLCNYFYFTWASLEISR